MVSRVNIWSKHVIHGLCSCVPLSFYSFCYKALFGLYSYLLRQFSDSMIDCRGEVSCDRTYALEYKTVSCSLSTGITSFTPADRILQWEHDMLRCLSWRNWYCTHYSVRRKGRRVRWWGLWYFGDGPGCNLADNKRFQGWHIRIVVSLTWSLPPVFE